MEMTKKNEDMWGKVFPWVPPLTAILFFILPALGFYGGMKYQQKEDQLKTEQIITNTRVYPDTLIVSRSEDKIDSLPSLEMKITDKENVTKLYNEIFSLPYIPIGVIHCPIQFFAEYNLNFYQSGKQVIHATFNPTGCSIIQITNGKARRAFGQQGQAFIQDLQGSLGISGKDFYGSQ